MREKQKSPFLTPFIKGRERERGERRVISPLERERKEKK